MAIDIYKEVNRMDGYAVAGGQNFISGQAAVLSDFQTITPYAGSGDVLGLALDDTNVFVLANIPTTLAQSGTTRELYDRPSGNVSAGGLFYTTINRGGLVAVAVDGGVFGLLNDGRGSPFDVTPNHSASYAVNAPLYAKSGGNITCDSADTGAVKIGVCLQTPATNGELVLSLRLAA
jgi:hypothetical protein